MIFTSVESVMAGDWRLMGRTSLLMFPIYGLGVVLGPIGQGIDRWFFPIDRVKRIEKRHLWLRHGFIYMVLIFTGEYISGLFLKTRGICPWDYTGKYSNINGLIRLDFAPLWFLTGLLFEKITKAD